MQVIIIIVLAILLIRYFKNKRSGKKPVKVVSIGDPAALPNTLSELRRMRDKAQNEEIRYQCRRKICELGIELYREGKIVNDPNSRYDVSVLIEEMYQLIHDVHMYEFLPEDEAFEFRCLEAGTEMTEKLDPPSPTGGGVFQFLEYAWEALAEFYAEGKVCPRNPQKARKYFRMRIVYEIRMKDSATATLKKLMEIPNAGEDGKMEIQKFIAMKYGLGAAQVLHGDAVRNCWAQTLQQAADLLFAMDWTRIGGADINEMLDEYRKGAAEGNAYALYKLGEFCVDGRYIKKNEESGLALLQRSAEQGLYLAVDKLSDYYHWLAHPYAGDYGGASKEQIREWTRLYDKWSKRCDAVLAAVEKEYAGVLSSYFAK